MTDLCGAENSGKMGCNQFERWKRCCKELSDARRCCDERRRLRKVLANGRLQAVTVVAEEYAMMNRESPRARRLPFDQDVT
jgi:hypothetical protein